MKRFIPSIVLLLLLQGMLTIFHSSAQEIPTLMVQHETKGKDVLVECIVTGISFRESNQSSQKIGKMVIWIDGKRNREVTTAAFIIKGLPQGTHKVRLEVVKLNNEPYGLVKEFMVNVPK
ncbi:hypothetical protein [Neobacillus sp. PS2-9]|uniref:hypothetical protein n=1 Tax=Neobacillus sp. PS2-9 TaxID=3070676 RepID=UPI0027DFF0DE|nr:hypothetical protein [Neobacillus sp. PS2-9]WML56899.1 hypothetical protein RCG25_18485 [Neobacillus sp. PS2-9]